MNWRKIKCNIFQFCVASSGLFFYCVIAAACMCYSFELVCVCHRKGWVVRPFFSCLPDLLSAALFGTYLASYGRRR